jgi:hypothetical protein
MWVVFGVIEGTLATEYISVATEIILNGNRILRFQTDHAISTS